MKSLTIKGKTGNQSKKNKFWFDNDDYCRHLLLHHIGYLCFGKRKMMILSSDLLLTYRRVNCLQVHFTDDSTSVIIILRELFPLSQYYLSRMNYSNEVIKAVDVWFIQIFVKFHRSLTYHEINSIDEESLRNFWVSEGSRLLFCIIQCNETLPSVLIIWNDFRLFCKSLPQNKQFREFWKNFLPKNLSIVDDVAFIRKGQRMKDCKD